MLYVSNNHPHRHHHHFDQDQDDNYAECDYFADYDYYADYDYAEYRSERVAGIVAGGGLSQHDCREIFRHQIEKVTTCTDMMMS